MLLSFPRKKCFEFFFNHWESRARKDRKRPKTQMGLSLGKSGGRGRIWDKGKLYKCNRAKWVERKDERVSIGRALCVGLLFNNLKRGLLETEAEESGRTIVWKLVFCTLTEHLMLGN